MLDPHALDVLEFPKIRERLAGLTGFSVGRELAASLAPSTDLAEVRLRQEITTEARRLLELQAGATVGGARDVRASIRRAALGGELSAADLLEVAGTLAGARVLRGTILKLGERLRRLVDLAAPMADRQDLEEAIERCFDERGEVVDHASPTLARIRREMRVARDRLVEQLNGILQSTAYRPIIQDAIITDRGGRYVIPIRSEARGQIRAVVHDQSSSGATLFVEPLAVVELNNRWRELQLEERNEVQRILRELSGRVGEIADTLTTTVESLGRLDLALAKAHLAATMNANEPELVHPDAPHPDDGSLQLRLLNARHPLLTGRVVPISVQLGDELKVLLITGPNTGGKTVALKTVGLLTAMAQAGLHLPAEAGTRVRVFDQVLADIGDEQSIEQSLSTFSSHLTTIIAILGAAGPNSLVLLDELGAGTDPTEGSALARAIVDQLLAVGAPTIATTHYSELKTYAHVTPGVRNANVEFDVETLAPTYRLTIGLPGRSNALAIAARLGLPEPIVAAARAMLSAGDVQVERLLEGIQEEHERAVAARREADQAVGRAAEHERRLRQRLRQIDRERAELLEAARREAEEELLEVRERLRAAAAAVERATSAGQAVAPAVAEVREAERILRERRAGAQPIPQPEAPEAPAGAPRVGDAVRVRSIGEVGTLLAIAGGIGEVQLGAFKARVPLDDLQRARQPAPAAAGGVNYVMSAAAQSAPSAQIELRGRRADEVGAELDGYLNQAYLAGLPTVRIVHGKGTGALRHAVRDFLEGHPLVRSFELAPLREGGEGATIAVLNR